MTVPVLPPGKARPLCMHGLGPVCSPCGQGSTGSHLPDPRSPAAQPRSPCVAALVALCTERVTCAEILSPKGQPESPSCASWCPPPHSCLRKHLRVSPGLVSDHDGPHPVFCCSFLQSPSWPWTGHTQDKVNTQSLLNVSALGFCWFEAPFCRFPSFIYELR